jgi:osmotically-inducible protein OsmY
MTARTIAVVREQPRTAPTATEDAHAPSRPPVSPYAPGTPVLGADGRIGTVAGIRVDPKTDRPRFLLVRQPRLFGLLGTTRLVPASAGSRAEAGEVMLSLTREDVAGLPPVRGDRDLRDHVWEAIRREVTVRLFRRGIRIAVEDGVVSLEGYAKTPTEARRIERAAAAVPGVVAVLNHLHDDETLTYRVAGALIHDPDTRRAHLRVDSRLGEVSLTGTLPSAAARETATSLAAAVPGVARVHSAALVRPNAQERTRP